jgi:hypothetical protein
MKARFKRRWALASRANLALALTLFTTGSALADIATPQRSMPRPLPARTPMRSDCRARWAEKADCRGGECRAIAWRALPPFGSAKDFFEPETKTSPPSPAGGFSFHDRTQLTHEVEGLAP